LIDVTDELAYNTADLDDGYEAHLLTLEQIIENVPVFARFFEEVEKLYPAAPKKLQFNEVLRRILDRWVGDLIQNTQSQIDVAFNKKDDQCNPGRPRPGSSAECDTTSTRRPEATLDDIRAYPKRLVGLSPKVEAERAETKEFLHRNLYYSPALQPEKEDAERVIAQLFDLWMKRPEKLPASYQEKAKNESEPRARVVCDYIAGMTDTYIYEQYEKYCGP
jgi:dGTPase